MNDNCSVHQRQQDAVVMGTARVEDVSAIEGSVQIALTPPSVSRAINIPQRPAIRSTQPNIDDVLSVLCMAT